MARLALSAEALARGELVELFAGRRLASPYARWLIKPPAGRISDEARRFCEWIEAQAVLTRAAMASA